MPKKEQCDCKHTMHFAIVIGNGCAHIVPHPTKKQFKEEILPMFKLFKKYYK